MLRVEGLCKTKSCQFQTLLVGLDRNGSKWKDRGKYTFILIPSQGSVGIKHPIALTSAFQGVGPAGVGVGGGG